MTSIAAYYQLIVTTNAKEQDARRRAASERQGPSLADRLRSLVSLVRRPAA